MNRDLAFLRRSIEQTRIEMVRMYEMKMDLRAPEVLKLSCMLDEQLNRYDQCKTNMQPAS